MNKLTTLIFVLILLATNIYAQDSYVSTSEIQAQFSDPSIKLSFHSWGEGRTTELRLDEYFIGDRATDERYLQISPPEIEVIIDQETSIVTLKARGKWIGTKDVIFTRSSLYNIEKSLKELAEFESELIKKRIPPKIKGEFEEFQDEPLYNYMERILDGLEKKKSTQTPDIKATFSQNKLSIDVGDDIDMSVSVITNIDGKQTRKPELNVNIRPGFDPTEEEEEQEQEEKLSIIVLFPLFLIGGTLLFALVVFGIRNKSKLKNLIPRLKPTKPELITKDVKIILKIRKEIAEIESKLNKVPLKESKEKLFKVIKDFFNVLTHASYEFTYTEVTKEILEEQLKKSTQSFLIKLSKELEDFRYGNEELTSEKLKSITSKFKIAINLSLKDIANIRTEEEIKLEKRKPIINLFINLKKYFKGENISHHEDIPKKSIFSRIFSIKRSSIKELRKLKLQKIEESKKKDIGRSKTIRAFFHDNFGLFKTSQEIAAIERAKEREIKQKEELRLKIISEKLKEKQRKKLSRRRSIKKFFHDLFGVYKTKQEIEAIKQKKIDIQLAEEKAIRDQKLAKRREKEARKQRIKNFFHSYFGLYKTRQEITAIHLAKEKAIRDQQLAKRREKEARKQRVRNFFHSYFGLFKTRQEIRFEAEEKLKLIQAKKREKLEKKLAKRRAIKNFFHNLGFYKTKEEKGTILNLKLEKERLKLRAIEEERKLKIVKRETIREFFKNNFGLFKTVKEIEEDRLEKEKEIKLKLEEKREKSLARRQSVNSFFHDFLGIKTRTEREELKVQEGRLKLKVLREKRKLREERNKAIRSFLRNNLGFYKTPEEKEKIKLQNLKEKRVKSIERRKALIHFLHDKLGLFKTETEEREERETKLRLKEKIRVEKIKTKEARGKLLRKFLHNNLGFYKTPEERSRIKTTEKLEEEKINKEKLKKLHLKLERKEKRRRLFRKFARSYLGLFKTETEIRKENYLQRLNDEKEARSKVRKLKLKQKRQETIKRFLHDNFGLFKTYEEKETERKKNALVNKKKHALKVKLEKRKLKLKQKRQELIHSFLHDKLGFYKTYEEKQERDRNRHKFLHDYIGLFKTKVEKIQEKKEKEEKRLVRRKFLHDKLGFFKTRVEIKKEAEESKIEKLELKNKIAKKTSFFKKLFQKKHSLDPSEEIKILMGREEEALKFNHVRTAKKLQKQIDKLYKKIEFKREHPNLSKNYTSFKEKISSIKNLFSRKPEKNKIDEVHYLIKKCENALNKNRKRDSQEYFSRIISFHKKLNRASKKIVQKDILTLRSEIASIAVEDSLRRAHFALASGEVKKAKALYKKVKENFYYLPIKHKERLLEDKSELAEKLTKKKRFMITLPKIPLPEFNIITLFNLEKEKVKDSFTNLKQKIKIEPTPKDIPEYKENFKGFLTARKPKFVALQTDLISEKHKERIAKKKMNEILKHTSHISNLIKKGDHSKAKEKYAATLELFKESMHELPKEFQHLVHNNLKPLKNKILHTSLHNLMNDVKTAVKKEEHILARELNNKIRTIHNHLVYEQELPFTPPKNSFTKINELLEKTETELSNKNYPQAHKMYKRIEEKYSTLLPGQKQQVYSKVLKLYKELSKF